MPIRRYALFLGLALVIGVGSGIASGLFLELLRVATETRETHPWLLFCLPVAGMLIAWLYAGYGKSAAGGNNLILDHIHHPQEAGVPLRMFPLILATTVITHLFGGSAGREGTAVQMGGAIAGDLARRLRLDRTEVRLALMCGISGGFSSVFGTPLAGTIFGMEMLAIGGIHYEALIPCLVAAFAGNETVHLLGVAHSHYAVTTAIPDLSVEMVVKVALIGIGCGLVSAAFSELTVLIEHESRRYIPRGVIRTATGGVAVIALTLVLGTHAYNGLSLPLIQDAFAGHVPTFAFVFKLVLTAVTLGMGFKGGEVTPLFAIGATFGATLASPFHLAPDFVAALGFIAVFAAAANTPIACVFMGAELFGGAGIAYFAIATFVAYTISGHRGIYHSQRILVPKLTFYPTSHPVGKTLRELRHPHPHLAAQLRHNRRQRRAVVTRQPARVTHQVPGALPHLRGDDLARSPRDLDGPDNLNGDDGVVVVTED